MRPSDTPKCVCEVLTSRRSECEFMWRQALCRGNAFKFGHYRGLVLYDRRPPKGREIGHRHAQRRVIERHTERTAACKRDREPSEEVSPPDTSLSGVPPPSL